MNQAFMTLWLLTSVAGADEPDWNPLVCQDDIAPGALVRCQTEPDTSVTLNGKSVMVGRDGRFVFGVGWKDQKVSLAFQADDVMAERHFKLVQRDYKTEVVNGLPSKTVSPPASWKKPQCHESLVHILLRKLP